MTGKPALYALVGMKHRGTEALVESLPNEEPLELIREPTNPFDPNAVQVWARGQMLGFISGKQVKPLAMAMDQKGGLRLVPATASSPEELLKTRRAKLHRSSAERWPLVEVE